MSLFLNNTKVVGTICANGPVFVYLLLILVKELDLPLNNRVIILTKYQTPLLIKNWGPTLLNQWITWPVLDSNKCSVLMIEFNIGKHFALRELHATLKTESERSELFEWAIRPLVLIKMNWTIAIEKPCFIVGFSQKTTEIIIRGLRSLFLFFFLTKFTQRILIIFILYKTFGK